MNKAKDKSKVGNLTCLSIVALGQSESSSSEILVSALSGVQLQLQQGQLRIFIRSAHNCWQLAWHWCTHR